MGLTKFRAPAIAVDMDAERQGLIAISPYAVTTQIAKPGEHELALTVYGNRYNTFGALHNTLQGADLHCTPNAWRTTGSLWAYEYQLRPTGPLKAPEIEEIL